MAIIEMLRKLTRSKSAAAPVAVSSESISQEQILRAMIEGRKFKEVVEIYQNGQIDAGSSVSNLVGYCYYQLTDYDEAIVHFKKAVEVSPRDYYSNFFLGVSLKAVHKETEAIAQFLNCLELHGNQASEIVDQLLPLVAELTDATEREQTFDEISAAILKFDPSNPCLAKILFYQRRDGDLTPEILHGSLFCHFYCAKDLTDSGHGQFMSLGTPEKLRFVRVENNSEVWVDTSPPYVAEITDATITSGSSLVLVGKNQILSEVLANRDFGKFADMQYDPMVIARRNDALLVKPFETQSEIPEGIMLCGLASGAYGHWFAEFLPKLRFFEKHPRFSQIPIIIDEGMPQSHYDFLSALVVNPTYRLAKGSTLRIKNLFVAPADTFFPLDLVNNHNVPLEHQSSLTEGALRYIGEGIRKRYGEPTAPTSRIFLSRRNSQWRRLIEEQDIIADLKELNFETVYVEDFSFDKQVQIFQNAEFIVAPNGSALNNLVFSSPSVKVLVLGQKNLFNWGGWVGSFMELGYSPEHLLGDAFGDKKQKHLDYSIPASIVRDKVKEMLNS